MRVRMHDGSGWVVVHLLPGRASVPDGDGHGRGAEAGPGDEVTGWDRQAVVLE